MTKTVFYDRHVALKAVMTEFGGWQMPLHYATGIIEEHLATRRKAGLFDVSHMARLVFRGKGVVPFLQHVLTNNAEVLNIGQSQYTIIANREGGAIDDAYLYRFFKDEYMLVVNAGNRLKDRDYFKKLIRGFKEIEMLDQTEDLAMISLQGPLSKEILNNIIDTSGTLPEPLKNQLSMVKIKGLEVLIGRTGYTGEPLGFELFIPGNKAVKIWDRLIEQGATPVGLGARDTLRLEASLPLYGHELGLDPEGKEIPVFACPLAKVAVSFSTLKGDFIGKDALRKQSEENLPRLIMPLALMEGGVVRAGSKVFVGEKAAGYVTSGTMVPYYKFEGQGLSGRITDEKAMRSIGLALVDSSLNKGDRVEIEIRGKRIKALIVPFHLRSEAPPYARPILYEYTAKKKPDSQPWLFDRTTYPKKAEELLNKALENTIWRQNECLNLIPSEQTPSPMTRLLSIMDPAFRYGEHKQVKAFYDLDIFYYQGTDFIKEVERLLENEMCIFLGCSEVETRLLSGQMANAAVFSAMVDHLNQADRKNEPRRIRCVLTNHIIKGGHLSSQPMGALKDFVAREPGRERPAVINFPVLAENPYKIDVRACQELIARYKPELIILGKSMVLHPEPVKEIRALVKELSLRCIIMYDMAHVLGLVGPYFQEPFKEGVDIVTGSTHKTFFGTQRGIIAANYDKEEERYAFWESIRKRTFPGSVSNHHLGTLLGLLLASYEMNYFKDEYQKKVLANAKTMAKALKDRGMNVAGDPKVSYTETHQVVVKVGYARGPEEAKKLEDNNIIVNFQAAPEEEGFTAAGALRMGVQEMTRFGMEEEDFKTIAQFIREVVREGKAIKEEVKLFRKKFVTPKFCFSGKEFEAVIEKLHNLI